MIKMGFIFILSSLIHRIRQLRGRHLQSGALWIPSQNVLGLFKANMCTQPIAIKKQNN
jgi:hypothetical protein